MLVKLLLNDVQWLDRNVYTENLKDQENSPDGKKEDALDQPGLKEMTLKAIDILHDRHGEDGFFLMSEAASIDKQMHLLDYDRALGELLELDDTIKATLEHLEKLGELENTQIVVTADRKSANSDWLWFMLTDSPAQTAMGST